MDRQRYSLISFFVLAVLFLGIIKIGHWYHQWISEVRLDTVKPAYYHYEFVDIRLRGHDLEAITGPQDIPLRAVVLWQGHALTTIGGLSQVDLIWNNEQGAYIGHWPCPWNAPEGEYQLALLGQENSKERLKVQSFRIIRRKPMALPHRFVVLTMETIQPLATMKVRAPDGSIKDWKGMLDWVQYINADAFWLLAGQTRADHPDEIWVPYNLPMMSRVAQECHRRGIKFGAYAMCYLTMSQERLRRYQYAEDIDEGKPILTRAISLNDPHRPDDIAALLKHLKADGADYVGLDYIRNALGGYELVDDFLREMYWISRPSQWDKLTREERILWMARKKISRKDKNFIDAWQWWRAHHVAYIVRHIRQEIGNNIPLWAFTLTWDKGWQHGQDPVMMNDAGIDADALMMYEATAPQFESMMNDWHAYVHRGDVQLIPGDVIDWPLHQKSPRGPGEFVYRLDRAMKDVFQDGTADGIFIHDLARALWGRLGPYSTLDWMQATKSLVARFRSLPDHPRHSLPVQKTPASVIPAHHSRPDGVPIQN